MPRSPINHRSPTFVKLINIGKLNRMIRNNQPGVMVSIPQMGDVLNMLIAAKWNNLVLFRGRNYYTHLFAKFYANMKINQSVDGIFHIVKGKNVHVDHNVLNRALRLGNKLLICIASTSMRDLCIIK